MWTTNENLLKLYEFVRDLSEQIAEQQSVTGQGFGLGLVMHSTVVEVQFIGATIWNSEETEANTIEEVGEEIRDELRKMMDAISRIDLGAAPDEDGGLVRLTYFKDTGKFNCEGEYRTKHEEVPDVFAEVSDLLTIGKLPGLTEGARPKYILVDPVGLCHRYPRLLIR